MFDMTHLSILVVVFIFMMSAVRLIPELWSGYRDRYQLSSAQTSRELSRFFINIKPGKILLIAVGIGLVLGLLTGSWPLAVALAVSGLIAPKVILKIWRDIRTRQVDAQLMDTLILISNSLKSGMDIAAAIERASVTLKPPISEEFGLVINAYRLGTPLETALLDMTQRIPSRTLEIVVYAISIQRETGGNIIRTFEQLITTIRDESKLQKKVSAMTSQGRTQIIFLAIFPWVLATLFFFASKDMMVTALQSSIGQLVLIFLLVWEGIGIIVTRKIVEVNI